MCSCVPYVSASSLPSYRAGWLIPPEIPLQSARTIPQRGASMQCLHCQADNRNGRRFCGECGAALAVDCPGCGFSNEGGEKFCGGCGSPLGATPAPCATAPPLEPTFRSPQTY